MKKLILILILIWFLCTACSNSTYREIPVVTKESSKEIVSTVKVDTIIVRDSVDRWLKGDTFYVTKVKTVYKYKFISDTVVKIDTIPKIITKTEIRNVTTNKLNSFQSFLVWLGVVFIIYILFKLLKK